MKYWGAVGSPECLGKEATTIIDEYFKNKLFS